jgi:SAM-dependent methyltransferase
MDTAIADYDSNGYDYRDYWNGRDYEQMAEDRALRRLMPRLGRARWFVDFGGGFGRNAAHYRSRAARYVIVDYSATNLANAARLLADDVAAGRAFLVRADLNALPFADAAFDAAMVVRVLHHLPDLDRALAEMGRVVGGRWLIDVPIKHHVLGVARGVVRRDRRAVHGPDPVRTTAGAEPFWNFQLTAVRGLLSRYGWQTRLVASVNNLRRWDRRLPRRAARAVRPAALLVEALAQRCGMGWWGPNQFVLAERSAPVREDGTTTRIRAGAPAVAAVLGCPRCRGGLTWSADDASCMDCAGRYERVDGYWDFTVPPEPTAEAGAISGRTRCGW